MAADVGKFDVREHHPDGRPSTPTDIGHCVAWMCSDYARLITGCDFVVDGGARAKYWGYIPPAGERGPVPLIPLDVTDDGGGGRCLAEMVRAAVHDGSAPFEMQEFPRPVIGPRRRPAADRGVRDLRQ